MGPNERQELRIIIQEVVKEELTQYNHNCRFDVDEKEVKEFNHFMGMMTDIGEGRMGSGVEVIRENHKWLQRQRERSDKLSTAILIITLSTIATGLVTAVWHGVRALLGK